MRAVNTFCTAVLLLAVVLTAIHYAATSAAERFRGSIHPPDDVDPFACLAPPGNIIELDEVKRWILAAQTAARDIARKKGTATIDDIWDACPPPKGMDPRRMTAAFPKSEWEVVGETKSRRAELNHGRRVAVWKRKGAA